MGQFEIVDEFIEVDVEDDLTKAVFGCLQLVSGEAMNEIFSGNKLDFSFESAPDFTFHEQVDKREPDVIIEDGQNLTIMVEAKLGAPTDTTQLSEEYADLTHGWDSETLCLLHVTKDRQRPAKIETETEIPPQNLVWTNWRSLAAALLDAGTAKLSTADQRVIEMLIQVFEDQGFTPFGGFTLMNESNSLTNQLQQAYEVRNQYYDEVDSFRKDVETHLTDNVTFWRFFRRGVSGGNRSGKKSFPHKNYQKIPRNLWFSYIPVGEIPSRANRPYNENYLFLDFNSKTGTVRAGYMVTTVTGKVEGDVFRETLHERKDTILELIQENGYQPYTTSYSLNTNTDSIKGVESFLDEIGDPSYNDSDWGRRFMLARTWTAEELPVREEGASLFDPAEVTEEVADALNEIHRLTYHEYDDIFYPEME